MNTEATTAARLMPRDLLFTAAGKFSEVLSVEDFTDNAGNPMVRIDITGAMGSARTIILPVAFAVTISGTPAERPKADQRLGITGPHERGDTFIVHAIECRDCQRDAAKCMNAPGRIMPVEASTFEAVAESVYGPDEFDYDPATEMDMYLGDFHFAPCVTGLTHRASA